MIKLIVKYLPSVVIPTIITFVITIIYGNYLTPAQYGEFNLFTTTVQLVNATIFTAITSSVLRFYNGYYEKKEGFRLISTYAAFLLVLILITVPFVFIFYKSNAFFFVLSLAGLTYMTLYTNLLRAADQAKWFNLLRAIIPLGTLAIIAIMIYFKKLNETTAIISMYAPMVFVSVYFFIRATSKGTLKPYYNKDILKESLHYGIPLAAVGGLNILLSSSSRYLIKYYLGIEQVGIYSFAYRIAELSMVNLTMVIMMALFPQLIKIFDTKGKEETEKLIKKYLNFHFISTLPLLCIFYLYIDEIMTLFFPIYKEGADIVKSVMFGTFFFTTSFYTNKAFELTKDTKTMLKVLIVTASLNIILNIILIPLMGTQGSVIATIISYIVYLGLSMFVSRNTLKIQFSIKNIVIIGICSLIPTGILLVMPVLFDRIMILDIIIKVCIYFMIYAILLLVLFKRKILSM